MSTKFPDLFASLAAPFDAHEVKLRSAPGGRQLHYVTARTVANRLDNAVGPENWWDRYVPLEHSVICELTIRLPDGTTITKCDAGGYAGMADQGDDDKSGFSDAFKRAAAKYGVMRYLYGDGVPTFVSDYHGEPVAPADTGRGGHHEPPASRAQAPSGGQGQRGFNGQPPRTGKALFAWTKDQEQRHQVGLLKYLNNWGKLQDWPSRMVDWDPEQVALAHTEAVRKLRAVAPADEDDEGAGYRGDES